MLKRLATAYACADILGVKLLDVLDIFLQHDVALHLHCRPQFAAGHGKILTQNDPLLNLLRVGERPQVRAVDALLKLKRFYGLWSKCDQQKVAKCL